MTARCALYMGAMNIFESPWVVSTLTATFAKIFNGHLFWSILWICVQILQFVPLPVPEIIGGTQKNLSSFRIRPRSLFCQIFNGHLFRSILWICVQNLQFVPLPVPEIIGGTQKNLSSFRIRPRSLFCQVFNGLLFGWTLWVYRPNCAAKTHFCDCDQYALAIGVRASGLRGLQSPRLGENHHFSDKS